MPNRDDDGAGAPARAEATPPVAALKVHRGPRWVWYFVVGMTLFNLAKYPNICGSTSPGGSKPYHISGIIGGVIPTASPHWFLLIHVPLMVVSNLLAAAIGFGWRKMDRNRFAYLFVILLEILNAAIILWPTSHIYTLLGSMDAPTATKANLAAIVLTVGGLTLSALVVSKRFTLFYATFFLKCLLIFGGEMASYISHLKKEK